MCKDVCVVSKWTTTADSRESPLDSVKHSSQDWRRTHGTFLQCTIIQLHMSVLARTQRQAAEMLVDDPHDVQPRIYSYLLSVCQSHQQAVCIWLLRGYPEWRLNLADKEMMKMNYKLPKEDGLTCIFSSSGGDRSAVSVQVLASHLNVYYSAAVH